MMELVVMIAIAKRIASTQIKNKSKVQTVFHFKSGMLWCPDSQMMLALQAHFGSPWEGAA